MPRFAYINGSYKPHHEAMTHIEDRGFQFADGVYEVISLINGIYADERGHLDRLERSLSELQITMPVKRQTLCMIVRELVRRNRISNALIYIQITRGVARRNFPFPPKDTPPTLVITARHFDFKNNPRVQNGIEVITVPDIRWKRPDIKSVALLPQVLAKQEAYEKGAGEAWMLDSKGNVTEGSSTNTWILDDNNNLITHDASADILKGVTRNAVIHLCDELGLTLCEKSFTPKEAYMAREALNTSASELVVPVIAIDGHKIGNGKPGPVARRLYSLYMDYVAGLKGEQVKWTA